MFSQIIEELGESVTVVRLSADKEKNQLLLGEIVLNRDEIRTHQKCPSHKGKRRCEYYY